VTVQNHVLSLSCKLKRGNGREVQPCAWARHMRTEQMARCTCVDQLIFSRVGRAEEEEQGT